MQAAARVVRNENDTKRDERMANDEVLGPRKTMFVLVIVVGCFAVLWPRIISPLILGSSRDSLKPNQFDREAAVKQERPLRGVGPHPALRERGRAIPAGAPTPPSRGPVPLPPHLRVRSPLSGYFDIDVKPPPIPGMRPPLGSAGGPVTAPKSSMGFVMPIYTICIIVFFVYTLSKLLFKRTGPSPYEEISSDPHFRRRVFRDDSRSSPETKLGDEELAMLRARLAETERAMQRIVSQLGERGADLQDNHTRPYTNGNVRIENAPVRIIASEYTDLVKEKTPESIREEKEPTPEPKESTPQYKEPISEPKEPSPEPKEPSPEPKEPTPEPKEPTPEPKEFIPESKELTQEPKEQYPEPNEPTPELRDTTPELKEPILETKPILEKDPSLVQEDLPDSKDISPEPEDLVETDDYEVQEVGDFEKEALKSDLFSKVTSEIVEQELESLKQRTEDFLSEEIDSELSSKEKKQTTPELLEEALKEEDEVSDEETEDAEPETSTVKVLGMETRAHAADGGVWPSDHTAPPAPRAAPPPARAAPAHEAEEVKSIFLETEIPQQSKVLIADFAEDRNDSPAPTKNSSLVVSGKMTLSLIQDAPRETPERDPESTVDDFTTASALTQPAAEKDMSDEELEEEEIEIEEIDEEVEEIEEEVEEEEEEEAPAKTK